MIVQIDKGFVKDAERIKDQRLLNRIDINPQPQNSEIGKSMHKCVLK